ncbi:Cytochrome P450 61 [Penicillium atrosanguineum]|uniref:Cytochrome P450 61 n=1 Tax=Penicillium atrosanguineum TaxID=1132637 RepID=UPI00238B1933|nr:Cytochrome P450 61 [Penicillium atrosanguineum]KAJ5310320.1 Cytochrome P450 61 [Penicillium atrosanguineum]
MRQTLRRSGSLDPFDSYPQTRLPPEQVQRLIHSFLHKIAFQYYPLDLNATTNPFLVSWWPLALGDPALFHVSLQTACLDEELLAQKGFRSSEILMADSVALLRRKIGNTSLAVQDGTMNSVITLATIEFGKGNNKVAEMHVDGVKRLVKMRGGINSVRQTSPLTARMISWVSMLIMGHPQFDTQDDFGIGDGIPPIPEWQLDPAATHELPETILDVDYDVRNVFIRLRNVFQRIQNMQFPNTQLHDLTSFVIHRLLYLPLDAANVQRSPISECIRCAVLIYMFIIQGPTYYSHAIMLNTVVISLIENLSRLDVTSRIYSSLDIWLAANAQNFDFSATIYIR